MTTFPQGSSTTATLSLDVCETANVAATCLGTGACFDALSPQNQLASFVAPSPPSRLSTLIGRCSDLHEIEDFQLRL